jgi:hypothetical protein
LKAQYICIKPLLKPLNIFNKSCAETACVFENLLRKKQPKVTQMSKFRPICGLYYKQITIVNDNSSIINKFEASLTDDARVIIYDRHMFIVQATHHTGHRQAFTTLPKV